MDVGEWIVGLRANDEEVVDLLSRGLAAIRVDGVDGFPNLSLVRGDERGATRELHRLERRGVVVARTRSLGRLVRAAVAQLESFLAPPAGLTRLRPGVVVGNRGAVLVHDAFANLRLPQRRLARLGWQLGDGVALFDPETLEVVVPAPRFALDPSVAAEIEARWPTAADEGSVEPGRYPVRAVVLLGSQPDHLKVASTARRLAGLASVVDTSVRPVRAVDVEAVGRLEGRTEVVRALGFEPSEVVEILRALAR